MIPVLLFTLIVIIMVLGFRKTALGYKSISASQLDDFIKSSGIIILDVRSPHEFKSGHLPNAINIDFYTQNFQDDISKLDPSKPYLIHCKNGERSLKACKQMEETGFSQLYYLEQGIEIWVLNFKGQLVKDP